MAIALRVNDSPQPRADHQQVAAIVGDEPETHRRIAAVLSNAGWNVASNGARPGAVIACLDLARRGAEGTIEVVMGSFPDAVVVVVTGSPLGCDIRRALRAGAGGVVDEARLEATLVPTVCASAAGLVTVPRDLRDHLTRPILSYREKQIVSLVAAGATNRQIADNLYLAESTVKNHLSSVFLKLGVRSRLEVAAAALDPAEGLIDWPPAPSLNGDGPR